MSQEHPTFLSTHPQPLNEVKPDAPRVLVIGAGVIGLTTAWTLLDRGYKVTIVTAACQSSQERLVSQISGALWEYPPAVCGHDGARTSPHLAEAWSMVSYHAFARLAREPVSESFGVEMRTVTFLFTDKVLEDKDQRKKMRNIERSGVAGFRHVEERAKDFGTEDLYHDAYQISAPVIDTDLAMLRLERLVNEKGGIIKSPRKLEGKLVAREAELLKEYEADVIVNASGLGAKELAGDDTVYPLRGAVVRVHNEGKIFPTVDECYVVSAKNVPGDEKSEFIFIVPRNDNIVILGGFSEPNNDTLDLTGTSGDVTQIVKNFGDFIRRGLSTDLMALKAPPSYPIAQGLRPARDGGVRVERECENSRIVHSYGHAGSGWSLSFGCALHVLTLVEDVIADLGPANKGSREGSKEPHQDDEQGSDDNTCQGDESSVIEPIENSGGIGQGNGDISSQKPRVQIDCTKTESTTRVVISQ
ncbi:hypothetical protein CERSUDRAFT_98964 [Gelatoporia subvermispora B]|uniref:FAD dependent oxidoreductase domain-containing protein n=1 Tax=Ceriporiopsis subvermispora (strain B) TaxID=914234 RepID=M2R264_CERS8|nr:hypothetical protein CERSUDRAFT_98964 [Gelatoporia subvermispora B]